MIMLPKDRGAQNLQLALQTEPLIRSLLNLL
jgi:hypothetical protein